MPDMSIGANGYQAARRFKQVPPAQRHSTAVQYTPSITDSGATNDLFRYTKSFAREDGTFGAAEIEAASGLDLNKLPDRRLIESLWDLNNDGKVETPEAAVGLAHIDAADSDGLNGQITEAGRTQVEGFFAGPEMARMKKIQDLFDDPAALAAAIDRGEIDARFTPGFRRLLDTLPPLPQAGEQRFEDPAALKEAIDSGRLTGFSPGFRQMLDQIPAGQDIHATFEAQRAALRNSVLKDYHGTYKGILTHIASPDALDVNQRYGRFLDLTA